ncbi:MAG TPA: Ig-like domain-containing protein [Vicinamibacterales bacterium]|nr:Ig-like domain-containing protein [Vicinamibacterales bacterium]
MRHLYLLALATVVVVVACDSVPLTSPTGSTISISIDKNVLPLNGQATVRAVVTEVSGTAVHNGTMVTFQPSIGSVNPPEAPTVNGIATATFLAGGSSGAGVIHAFSGGARTGSGNSSSGGVEVKIGSAAAGSLSVSSTPPSVSQSGGTVTISALVLDSSNNPLPGVSVLFTSSAGTLSATTGLSDSNGIARTTLATTQTTTVTAIAGAVKSDVQVVVSSAPSVTVNAPDTGVVGTPVPISVSVSTGGAGNNTPRQVQTLTIEYGDGSRDTRSNVTGTVALTHTYQNPGGYTITATAVDVSGNTGNGSDAIVISRSQPTVTLTAPATVDFSDTGGVAGFTVAATSAAGQPPIQSVTVRLGDGTVIYSGSNGGSFTYQFGGTGTYAVNATATDTAGGVGTASSIVRVVP